MIMLAMPGIKDRELIGYLAWMDWLRRSQGGHVVTAVLRRPRWRVTDLLVDVGGWGWWVCLN